MFEFVVACNVSLSSISIAGVRDFQVNFRSHEVGDYVLDLLLVGHGDGVFVRAGFSRFAIEK